jgi:hypothetical protein
LATSGRERTVRVVLGALLSSDISSSDLRRFANDLMRGDVVEELRRSLLGVLDSRAFEPKMTAPNRADDAERLFKFVKNKKLTKEQVTSVVAALAPSVADKQFRNDLSIRGILSEFADNVSDPYHRFTSFVDDQGRSDPYLRGIIGRSS